MSSYQSTNANSKEAKTGKGKGKAAKYSKEEYAAYGGAGRNATAPVGHAIHQDAVSTSSDDSRRRKPEGETSPPGGDKKRAAMERYAEAGPSGSRRKVDSVDPEGKWQSAGVGKTPTVESAKEITTISQEVAAVPVIEYWRLLGRYAPHYCHLCTNPVTSETAMICQLCGAIVCVGQSLGVGCIAFGTVKRGDRFVCHVCIGVHKNDSAPILINYYMNRSAPRAYAKLCWPLLLIPMKLVNLPSLSIATVLLASRAEYQLSPKNLLEFEITLRGGEGGNNEKREESCKFLETSRKNKQPANTIVIIDSHSDPYTGHLQSGANDQYDNISNLLDRCLGKGIREQVLLGSVVSRAWKEDVRLPDGTAPWTDLTPRVRGGWRVLIALVCGSTMKGDSYRGLLTLVENNEYDIIVGFTGPATLPFQIYNFVSRLAQMISTVGVLINNEKAVDPWHTVSTVIIENQGVLNMHNVLVITREGKNNDAVAREVGLHSAGRPFGLVIDRCGAMRCVSRGQAANIVGVSRYHDMKNRGRIRCAACGWTSTWVRIEQLTGLVFPLSRLAPSAYFHYYPLCGTLESRFFIEQSPIANKK